MAPPYHHVCGFYYSTFHPDGSFREPWRRHYLPQVALKFHTTILSTVSRTLLTQTFTNPSKNKAIKNLRYTFPLFDGVFVVGFTCRVGNRTIRGQVKAKEKAKAVFNKAFERGQTIARFEQLPDASDVFTTTIANVPAGALIVSEITYLGELKHDAEVNGFRFTIPTAIAPRYGQYPGDILWNTSTPAQAKDGMEITVDAVMENGSFIQQLRSPSHPINIAVSMGTTSTAPGAEPTMTKASATLSLGIAELDKDFVLQIVAKETGTPAALLECHPTIPHQRALMATLVPKFALPSIRPEIVFLCDRSGSMGFRIPTAIAALKVFLKSLPLGVKFNICSFGDTHQFLWPRSRSYNQKTLNTAVRSVEDFKDNFGGTEILSPIRAAIENRYTDMDLEIMLLTDGDVWQRDLIFDYLNEEIGQKKAPIRVFTLGVGALVSHALIEGAAKAGNGFSQAVGDNETLDSKVVRMLKGALSPHITDCSLEVRYARSEKGDVDDDFEIVEKVSDGLRVHLDINYKEPKKSQEPQTTSSNGQDRYPHLLPLAAPAILQAPTQIPPLFPFSRSTVYLLLSPTSPAADRTPTSVIFRATSAHNPLELEIPVQAVEADGKSEMIHQLAAHKAVLGLEEGRGWLNEAKDERGVELTRKIGRWREVVDREALRLGVEFQVGGRWCSLVSVEEKGKGDDGKEEGDMNVDTKYLDVSEDANTAHIRQTIFIDFPPLPPAAADGSVAAQAAAILSRWRRPVPMQQMQMQPASPMNCFHYGRCGLTRGQPRSRGHFAGLAQGQLGYQNAASLPSHLTDNRGGESVFHRLIDLQTFEGYWKWTAELFGLMGITQQGAREAGVRGGGTGTAATVFVVAFMKTQLAEEREAWELVVEKAMDWLADVYGPKWGDEVVAAEKCVRDQLARE